jgi:protein-disulfide isomerase
MQDFLARLMKNPRHLLIAGGILAAAGIAGVAAMAVGTGHRAGTQPAVAASAFGPGETKSSSGAPNVKSDYHPTNDANAAPPRNLETKNTGNTNVAVNTKNTGYKDGPLDVITYGPASAPVTIIEYGSFTCPHCAAFHEEVLPKLKERYFNKGTARLIFRPFFRNEFDVDAGLFIACLAPERRSAWVSVLFHQQENWVPFGVTDQLEARQKARDNLEAYSVQAGMTPANFDKCLANEPNKAWLQAVRDQGIKDGLEGTPLFLIGSKTYGPMEFEEFQKLLDPLVAKAQGRS